MSINFKSDFENNFFNILFKKYNYEFSSGDIISGKFISLEKFGALVDIGAKKLSYLPISEVSPFYAFSSKNLFNRNDFLEFILTKYDTQKNIILISLKKFKSILNWQIFKELIRDDIIISGQVRKSSKQGKLVFINGLKGFIFNSHLPKYYRRKQLNKLNLPLKFLELAEGKNKILLSCKLAHFKNQTNFLKPQQILIGCVIEVKPYGLFVNIYGAKGLLHISEISSKRINNLSNLFKKGQLITVTVLYINLNKGRISLTAKPFESNKF
jgi:small subunit ribosomal protein S1